MDNLVARNDKQQQHISLLCWPREKLACAAFKNNMQRFTYSSLPSLEDLSLYQQGRDQFRWHTKNYAVSDHFRWHRKNYDLIKIVVAWKDSNDSLYMHIVSILDFCCHCPNFLSDTFFRKAEGTRAAWQLGGKGAGCICVCVRWSILTVIEVCYLFFLYPS